jgi:hypothetical protein
MSKFGGGGNPCTICEKTVYPAEAIQYEKLVYHIECFKCSTCDKKMEGASKAANYEDKIYCKHCFDKGGFAQKQKNVVWTKKEGGASGTSKFGGGGNPCKICTKTVYPAETVSYEKTIFHAECFKCTTCEKKMTPSSAGGQFEDHVYCKKCFVEGGFNKKQLKSGGGTAKSNALASKFGGGGNPCTVCSKTVYPAETVSYEKTIFHSQCFLCTTCNKQMTPSNAGGKFEEQVYCKKCFVEGGFNKKQLASKGAGSSSNALASKFGGGGNKCSICEKTVYPAETVSYEKTIFHSECFKCTTCDKQMTPSNAGGKFEDKCYCKKCFVEGGFNKKQLASGGSGATQTNALASKFGGGGNKCEICTNTVYPAETVSYEKKCYHGDCFKCSNCDKKMEPSGAAQYEEKLFCTKCFSEGGYARKQANVTGSE